MPLAALVALLADPPLVDACSTALAAATTRELRHDAINSFCSSMGSSLKTCASTPAGQGICESELPVAAVAASVMTLGAGDATCRAGAIVGVVGALTVSSMGEGSGDEAVELAVELMRLAVRAGMKRRLPSMRLIRVFGGWMVRKRGAGVVPDVDGEQAAIGLIGKSFSLSREFRRRSQTRSLLGEATSAGVSVTSTANRLRFETTMRPMRLFLGDGSTSVSEKSLKSEFVAADSEPLSKSIGTGDAVVARRL